MQITSPMKRRSITCVAVLLWAIGIVPRPSWAVGGEEPMAESPNQDSEARALGPSGRPRYPLIGWQTFNGAVDDFYARFDLLVYRDSSEARVRALKDRNRRMKIVWTFDWNAGEIAFELPDRWKLKDSQGNVLNSYGRSPMMNLSEFSPVAGGPYGRQTYLEFIVTHFKETAKLSDFDGWGTNGVWGYTGMFYKLDPGDEFADVDVNNNCVVNGGNKTAPACEDHNEPIFQTDGKFDRAKWATRWQNGIDEVMRQLRKALDKASAAGSPKLLIINSGTQHKWGYPQTNGIVDEKLRSYFDNTFDRDFWKPFKRKSDRPHVSVADGYPEPSSPDLPGNTKNDLRGMRFGLVTSMFNDVYFSFQSNEAGEHYWSYWYDEFEASLGRARGKPKKIRPGLWVRFFKRGVAIASTNGRPQEVSDADLRDFRKYDGPYYRFRGGQDLALHGDDAYNNGQLFNSIILRGDRFPSGRTSKRLGDAIVLFKKRKTIVSDIVIDNVDMGTSPASKKASLEGFTQHGAKAGCKAPGRKYYTVRCSWNPGSYAFGTAAAGSVAAAVFQPTIGVPGRYTVYEWHPRLDSGKEARKARHVIQHASGTTRVTVNQRKKPGRWNKLGTFTFRRGTSGQVTIEAQSSRGGTVIADAVKFVRR